MVKRVCPLMESDNSGGMTPGGDLMREVDWCARAMGGVSTEQVPDHVAAPVAESRVQNEFDFSEGTRPVVEDMISVLENILKQAQNTLQRDELEAMEGYEKDITVLHSILNKLSMV